MADKYIKREDAKIILQRAWIEDPFRRQEAFDELNSIPSADVAEVVRCKDCSHGHKTSYPSELRICLTTGCAHSENHFCSDGKRMDDE